MSRANLLRTPIQKADINEYIASADDFQLEIEVFRLCLGAGFRAEHGGSYKDPVTKLNRQFDVRAYYGHEGRFLKFAIECKCLVDFFPLVVSRVPRRSAESHCHALMSVLRSGGPRLSFYKVKGGLFPQDGPVGKATTQLGRKDQKDKPLHTGDAEVYEKWAQAIASSHDLVAEACYDCKEAPNKLAVTIVLPILVVSDKTLWVMDYTNDGVAYGEPTQVDECSIYLNTKIIEAGPEYPVSYPVSHLQVFTKKGFMDFLQRFVNGGMERDYLLPDSRDIRDAAQQAFGDLP